MPTVEVLLHGESASPPTMRSHRLLQLQPACALADAAQHRLRATLGHAGQGGATTGRSRTGCSQERQPGAVWTIERRGDDVHYRHWDTPAGQNYDVLDSADGADPRVGASVRRGKWWPHPNDVGYYSAFMEFENGDDSTPSRTSRRSRTATRSSRGSVSCTRRGATPQGTMADRGLTPHEGPRRHIRADGVAGTLDEFAVTRTRTRNVFWSEERRFCAASSRKRVLEEAEVIYPRP